MFGIQHSVCWMFPTFIHGFSSFSTSSYIRGQKHRSNRTNEMMERRKTIDTANWIVQFRNSFVRIYVNRHQSHFTYRPHSTINSVNINNKYIHIYICILWESTISWHNTKYFDQHHHNSREFIELWIKLVWLLYHWNCLLYYKFFWLAKQ